MAKERRRITTITERDLALDAVDYLLGEIDRLTAELDKVTKERDAAVADMNTVFERKRKYADSDCIDGFETICDLCACYNDGYKTCNLDCENAEYRGTEDGK
jgi:uncharacterized small protein (DUF1192 family)